MAQMKMKTHMQSLLEVLPHFDIDTDGNETDLGYFELRVRFRGAPVSSSEVLHLYEMDSLSSFQCTQAAALARVMDAHGVVFVTREAEATVEETLQSLTLLGALSHLYLLRRVHFSEAPLFEKVVLQYGYIRYEPRTQRGRPTTLEPRKPHALDKSREPLFTPSSLGLFLGITRAGASKYFRQRGWSAEATKSQVDSLLREKLEAIRNRVSRLKLSSPINIPEDLRFFKKARVKARSDLYLFEQEAFRTLKQQKRLDQLGRITPAGFTLSTHGPVLVFAREDITTS